MSVIIFLNKTYFQFFNEILPIMKMIEYFPNINLTSKKYFRGFYQLYILIFHKVYKKYYLMHFLKTKLDKLTSIAFFRDN